MATNGDTGGEEGCMRRSSSAALLKTHLENSGTLEKSVEALNVSRVSALRASIERHSDMISRALLTSKDTANNRATIEAAFRACREAFLEVSTVLVNKLDEKIAHRRMAGEDIRKVVEETLASSGRGLCAGCKEARNGGEGRGRASYASIARSPAPEIQVSRGPTIELPKTTSFMIVPEEESRSKYTSSQEVKETLCKVLKPAECGLRVSRLTLVRDGGVRVEALSPDLGKIKDNEALAKVGLKVQENIKYNPRLIVHGVPADMAAEDIVRELVAQNLEGWDAETVKMIYLFKAKQNKYKTSCVIEVIPEVRKILLERGRIFLRYAACALADHVRIVQCFKCLSFGHYAANCRGKPSCGHCTGEHEMKDCRSRGTKPRCANCVRQAGSRGDSAHSAIDATKCPILLRKIRDKIALINYG
ncbi:PREDICTED: uncharacterized protein LOC105558396 [Vollenhovia emeryi]|uniref:uncharacterized protein LOC105558396 n=1 Tax=Vollenhovia emeryi TaxID=411798 RepID=UPI0005F55614|nr:PREDICTED: uncharacterized protein LOC105558396 [Vollenhovia emeryi]